MPLDRPSHGENIAESIQHAEAALKKDRKNSGLHFHLASLKYSAAKQKEAYRHIKKAIRYAEEGSGRYWIAKGYLEEAMGKPSRARNTYLNGMEADPGQPFLGLYLGLLEQKEGNPAVAEPLLAEFLKKVPSDARFYQNLAQVQVAQEKYEAALTTLAIAENQLPDRTWPLMLAGDVLFRTEQYNDAARKFTAVTLAEPSNAEAWVCRGEAAYRVPMPDVALESFEKALALDSLHQRGRLGRAKLRISFRQFELAISDLKQYIIWQPQQTETYFLLGRCYFETAQYGEAIAAFDVGLKQQPEDAEGWLFRGDALERGGNLEEAKKSWRKAQKYGSDKATVRLSVHDSGLG
jgi:tetratricopeptide (TPR) repeat protein